MFSLPDTGQKDSNRKAIQADNLQRPKLKLFFVLIGYGLYPEQESDRMMGLMVGVGTGGRLAVRGRASKSTTFLPYVYCSVMALCVGN